MKKELLVLLGVLIVWSLVVVSAQECKDSDGNNLFVKGIASLGETHIEDCDGKNYVNEYFCDANNIVKKNEYFFLSNGTDDFEIRYKGADKITDMNPEVIFTILDENDNREIFLNINGTFTLYFKGRIFNFVNASYAGQDDFDIQLVNGNLLKKPANYKRICPTGTGCSDGKCVSLVANCNADFDRDGVIGALDLYSIREKLGRRGSEPYSKGDVNFDGRVNMLDLIIARNNLDNRCWENFTDFYECEVSSKNSEEERSCSNSGRDFFRWLGYTDVLVHSLYASVGSDCEYKSYGYGGIRNIFRCYYNLYGQSSTYDLYGQRSINYTCSDSDGFDVWTKDFVNVTYINVTYGVDGKVIPLVENDFCSWMGSDYVVEKICYTNGTAGDYMFKCPNGCSDGRCK